MCFGFGEPATTRRDKYYYRGEEIFPSRPVSSYSYNGDRYAGYRNGYRRKEGNRDRDRDWDSDRYSVSNNPRSSYHSYHHHRHHSDHRHHRHGHHDHHGHHSHHDRDEYRRDDRNERERYYYAPSAWSSLTTANENGYGGYGVYGNAYIPVTGSGTGRLLGRSGEVPMVTTPRRRRSSVGELLTVAEGQRQLEVHEQEPVVYERTTQRTPPRRDMSEFAAP